MSDTGTHAAPRGRVRDSLVDYQAHYSEANESPTRQFNNGGSTGRSEYDRTQVGSEKDAKVTRKMEIRKKTKEEEGEEPKEQGTRFATRAGVPAQELEADTGCPVPARDEQLEDLDPRTMDEDHQDIATRTSSDQDQDNGVQTMTKETEDKDDKEDSDDEDEAEQAEDLRKTEDKTTVQTDDTAAATTAEATAANMIVAAASALDSAHTAAAKPDSQFSNNDNLCSDVRLTRAGAGGVRGTPGADGEGTGKAEAPCLHPSAGDAKYVASAWQARNHAGLHRGTQPCVSQHDVGTGSTLNIPTSAHKSHTPVMNENPLTTGADSVAKTGSVVAQTVENGILCDSATDVNGTAILCDSQARHTQTPGASSLVTAATVLTVSGGDGGDMSGDSNPNDQQQNHNEMPSVGAVASATEDNTLSDDTSVAVRHERLAGAAAMAAVENASTGPMETGANRLSECCTNAVLNVSNGEMAANGVDAANGEEVTVLDEEVTHQLRLAGTPGGFSDLDKVDATARVMQVNLSVKTASWKKVYAAVAAVAATEEVDDAAEPVAAVAATEEVEVDDAAEPVAAVSVFQVDPGNNGMGSLSKQEIVAQANERESLFLKHVTRERCR